MKKRFAQEQIIGFPREATTRIDHSSYSLRNEPMSLQVIGIALDRSRSGQGRQSR